MKVTDLRVETKQAQRYVAATQSIPAQFCLPPAPSIMRISPVEQMNALHLHAM